MANGLEAVSDDLEKLYLDAEKEVDLQAKTVASIEELYHDVEIRNKRRTDQVGKLKSILSEVKDKDFKLRAKMVVKAEKSLRDVKVEVESQSNKIVRIEQKLADAKTETWFVSELHRASNAQKLLLSAISEGETQAKNVAMAEELIRNEKNKGEKHARDIESTKKLLRDVEDESKLQANDIAKAEKFLRDLKKKSISQKRDLANVELLLTVKAGAKQAKKVEAAKQLLRELKVDIKFQALKPMTAKMLLRGAIAGTESHLQKIAAAIDSLADVYFVGESEDPHAKRIDQLLRGVKDKGKLEAKNIAEAEKLVKALAN